MQVFNDKKLILFIENNQFKSLSIFNYSLINLYDSTKIIIDSIIIEGKNLKIIKMEDRYLEIKGEIFQINNQDKAKIL